MESVGTKPLPRKGSRIRGIGALLAASGAEDFRPRATDSQVMATTNRVSRPAAASHSIAVAFERKPMASAMPITTAMPSSCWMTAPTTWPVRTDAREIRMVRKRATMPSVMSVATMTAVPVAAVAAAIRRMPGTT
jgi:hypothetical protein